MTYVSRFSALCRMKIRALHKDAKMYGVCRDVLLKLLDITGYIEVAFEMLAEIHMAKSRRCFGRVML